MKRLLLKVSVSKLYILLVGLVSLLIVGLYFSYAMFIVSKEKNNAITIVTGNLGYNLTVDGVSTNELVVPKGTTKTYKVVLSNPNNIKARFNIYSKGSIDSNVNIGYLKEVGVNEIPDIKGVNLEKEGTTGSSNTYIIRIINEGSADQTITLGVNVGLIYNDLELPSNSNLITLAESSPNAPAMDSNMIAVKYDGTKWVKAATDNWYNYDNGEWANAVTVKSDKLSTYQSLEVDKEVVMDDIETMWVWIPRYSYTIGSIDGTNYYGKQGEFLNTTPTQALPGEIDIEFISSNVKDKGTAKYIVSEGVSGWYTPDAFTYDSKELDGIWVGKFETSSSTPDVEYGGGNVTNLDPMIKPNVQSWRNINMKNIHTVSTKMTAIGNRNETSRGNRYGFYRMESHAMKNAEWGAVTYLSQSKYGKLGNRDYSTENKGVYLNNCGSYKTGCSAGNDVFSRRNYTYDISTSDVEGQGGAGTGASTTGNIYGVYDMAGGAYEYVMGNYNDNVGIWSTAIGESPSYISGFTVMPEVRYYNKYTTTDINTACNGGECLSHALSETYGWYNSSKSFVDEITPWLRRGGYISDIFNRSIFSFSNYDGRDDTVTSFRVVICKYYNDR